MSRVYNYEQSEIRWNFSMLNKGKRDGKLFNNDDNNTITEKAVIFTIHFMQGTVNPQYKQSQY